MHANGTLAHEQKVNDQAPSLAAIGRALGISKSLVHRYGKRGMPVHCVEAALAWRSQHVNIAARKPEPKPKPDADAVRLLQRLAGWAALAEQALKVGQFGLIEDDLRETMRNIPRGHRAAVELPVEVWRGLLAHIWESLGPDEPGAPMATAKERAEVGPILYGLACDEMILRDDVSPAPGA